MAGGTLEPPPGIDPDETRKILIYGVISGMLGVAFLSLCMRLYTRAILIKQFGWDDGAAIFAFWMVFGSGFAVMYQTNFGFATHVYFLEPSDIMLYLRTFYVSIVFYNAALFGIKLTFLLQYWRIIAIQRMKRVFYVAMFIVLGASLSQVPVQIFTCTPIAAFWDKSIPNSKCIDNQVQWFSHAGINILTDVIVFVLPLPVIGKLNLAKGQKYSLLGIFCLGFFTCALSVARIRFLKLTEDFTWTNVEAAIWSIAELSSGVLCSSLLTLRPLVVRLFPSMRSHAAKSSNQYYRQPNSHVSSPHDVELTHCWRKMASESKDHIVSENSRPIGQDSDSDSPTPWTPTGSAPVRPRRP